jgi:hypothetical protein
MCALNIFLQPMLLPETKGKPLPDLEDEENENDKLENDKL